MKWEGHRKSDNVEDRRNRKTTGMAIGGGAALVIMLLSLILNVDLNQFINPGGGAGGGQQPPGGGAGGGQQPPGGKVRELSAEEKKFKEFSATILGFTETVWEEQFQKIGKTYKAPNMVLFSDQVTTGGCGTAPSAVGPFYCPADQKVYIDPTFFKELEEKLGGSKAEFSQAYVIAHEVGHHVQNLLEYSSHVRAQQAKLPKDAEAERNQWSVRLELQADYLAGVWAHHGQKKFKFIEPGDIDAAITTAKAIGDDRIQKRAKGFTYPEGYTHGTSEQRVKWFRLGLTTGDLSRIKDLFSLAYHRL